MKIQLDDLSHPAVKSLLLEHLKDMHANSPAESVHALDLAKLKHRDIRFYTLWQDDTLAACGAVKQVDLHSGEIKSMRASKALRGRGFGHAMLMHLESESRRLGFQRLYLETGTADYFLPAQRLYLSHGFEPCPPFGQYQADPYSLFMTKAL
ncbi:GNAT family N-acetyltransferase [Shewanella sp. JM162201]|uniref:GNAT family N-acetyltransferase n=1 Tax=Shewanella jiangmenensis TaxID=2837387 RepID=A0ABS5V2R2_9GAMM|nr:GNAT family N-acetyltransferase [Shewanella jiangmenensis]MBT1444729.1 GNAT family N-acetyltransferase [Shewanella jiangmenensis]